MDSDAAPLPSDRDASARRTTRPLAWLRAVAPYLAFGAALAGLGLLWLRGELVEYRAKRVVAQRCEQLRRIGLGLLIYASEFEGAMPPSLSVLAERGDVAAADLLVSGAGLGHSACDFGYVGGLRSTDPPDLIVAYADAKFDEGTTTPALLLDGSIRFLGLKELGGEIARSLATVAQRGGGAARLSPPR